tara:strand:- start:2597 stop:3280 length:684 start_codon:yes stop_codon:yes gene_type:complete
MINLKIINVNIIYLSQYLIIGKFIKPKHYSSDALFSYLHAIQSSELQYSQWLCKDIHGTWPCSEPPQPFLQQPGHVYFSIGSFTCGGLELHLRRDAMSPNMTQRGMFPDFLVTTAASMLVVILCRLLSSSFVIIITVYIIYIIDFYYFYIDSWSYFLSLNALPLLNLEHVTLYISTYGVNINDGLVIVHLIFIHVFLPYFFFKFLSILHKDLKQCKQGADKQYSHFP